MALSAGQVSLSVKPDTKKFGSDLADGISSQSGMFSGLGAKIGGLVAGGIALAGFGELVKQATEASDATQKFGSTLQFAGIATDQIKALTASTQDYANQTVYGLSDIQNITAQLASNGVPHFDKLAEAAGNLNAIAGGTADTYKSVGMVLTQTAGQGKLTTENWNQLSDAIPGASGKLQDALLKAGAYTGNFRDAMAKGQITAGEFNDAIMKLGFDPVAVSAARSTTTIEGALGNLQASAVTALSGIITFVKPAITGAMNAVSSGISTVTAAVSGVFSLLTKGDFTAAFREAFHVEEDSPIVGVLLNIRSAFLDTKAILSTGFTENESILPPSVVAGLRGVRDLFLEVGPVVSRVASVFAAEVRPALATLGASFAPVIATIQSAFAGLWPTIQPLIPGIIGLVVAFSPLHAILTAIGPYLPQLVQSFGLLAAALVGTVAGALTTALPALTALGAVLSNTLVVAIRAILPLVFSLTDFLSHNAAIIGVVVGAYVAWRVASASISFAQVIVGLASSTAAWVANAAAVIASKAETVILMGMYAGDFVASIARNVAGVAVSTGAWIANTAAQVAAKAVILGGVAAMGIATAAQWLWNVAMDANPIGLIILAIGALVAAIIWVATQTTFFQDTWKVMTAVIGAAWNWLWANVISPVVAFIVERWNFLGSVIRAVWSGLIQPAINAVGAAFNTVSSIIGGVINGITGAIRTVGTTVHDVFGGIGDFIGGAFRTAASLVRGPMNTIIGLVNGAIDGVNSVGGAFGVHINHIPMLAKGGTITGAGQVIVGENGPELLTLPTGATVNPNINAGNNGPGKDRPIYADGVGLIAWIRELANGEARLVWAQGERATATAAGMGWSVNR